MATKAKSSGKGRQSGKNSSGKKASAQTAAQPIRREVGAVICFFLGLFTFIGYFDVDALFISYFCRLIKGLIGVGYYIFPPALIACAFVLGFHRGRPVCMRTVSFLMMPVIFGSIIHIFNDPDSTAKFGDYIKLLYSAGTEMKGGGAVSGLIGHWLKELFSVYGALPVLIFVFIGLAMLAFKISPAKIAEKAKNRPHLEYTPQPESESAPLKAAPAKNEEKKALRRAIDIPMDEEAQEEEYVEKKVGFFNVNPRVKTPDQILEKHSQQEKARESCDIPSEASEPESIPEAVQADKTVRLRKEQKAAGAVSVEPLSIEEAADIAGVVPVEIKTEEVKSADIRPPLQKSAISPEEKEAQIQEVAETIAAGEAAAKQEYKYPPVSLLRKGSGAAADGREEISINRGRLQATLDSFGVNATITDITRGPTVTRYDLELEAGVKLTKLTNLAGDLALSLGVSGVRIAPIPDKISTVGVEVPNKIVSTVYLGDIIDSDAFRSASSKLTFAIGEDIGGNCICGNIAKLPHMLIAGTTGSGKSVCMNSLILSLLYKATPDEVKLIMIDPKMVELGIYNGIPHLYIPVVTEPKKAAGSLQWAVVEMLKRYRLFSEAGVRDIASYNSILRKEGAQIIPQVVIVIDELADLMLVASKEVEESICRVAQMGRAAGMHLVIATQRPSADVITGLMKANIPSRIAFAVSSAMESRIILDSQGAEKLVGSGDMLYAPIGSGKPKRIQGAFVTDEEREEVVNFIKGNSPQAQYNEEIIQQIDKAAEEKTGSSSKAEAATDAGEKSQYDDLLPQAVDVILETKQASVSLLQRRLKLGYSRAARIVDQMEEIGVVGPFEGSKPRQILVTREHWQEMQLINGTAPLEKPDRQLSFADIQRDAEAEELEQ